MNVKIYSFDVYDTCLVRNFARPTDLFFVLAENILAKHYKGAFGKEEIVELARLRIEAEKNARQASDKEDITLDDIYRHFQDLDWWRIFAAEMMEAELRLEYESVRPILSRKRKIEALRKQSHRIIFISDMYLSQQFIRQMLSDHGLAHPDDPVYVSGEIGLTKQSGNLFQHVLEREGIKPEQLRHYGDNPRGDVVVPNRLGIKTSFFQQSQLNRYETQMLNQISDYPWLYSRLAGVSRVTRLARDGESDFLEITKIAANVVGPLLTCFVTWVLQDAHKKEIERLYFVSRDGQILLKIAQKLAKYMPAPECRYLYGSRQAWFLPSVFECNRKNCDWLILHSKTPRHLLKKLNIEPDEIEDILNEYNLERSSWDKQLDDQEIEIFWQVIEHPNVSSLILEKAAVARQTTLAYFSQEGLCSSNKWAIVDIGWTLKTQRSLKYILQQSGYNNNVYGYYLALVKERQPISEAGSYKAFLLEKVVGANVTASNKYFFRNVQLVEQVFTIADHGTAIGYKKQDNKILPILKDTPHDSQKKQFVAILQKVVLCYADELGKSGLLNCEISEFKQTILKVTREFFANPQQQEVQAIGWHLIGDDQNESRQHKLARKLGTMDIIYYAARLFRLTQPRDFTLGYSWFEGSLVISSIWIRLIFLPVRLAMRFKQNNWRLQIYKWWAKIVAKGN